jgi:hypothetical protein
VAAGPVCPLPREVSRGRAQVAEYPAPRAVVPRAPAKVHRKKPWRVPRHLAPSNLGRGRPRKVSHGPDASEK